MKINSILDLACGLNPIALANKDIFYYASDIKQDELSLIKKFFKKNKIKGKTFLFDLRKIEKIDILPKADLCLLFKVLDIIEQKNHHIAEKLIDDLKYRYLILSFSTKKLSGKPMNNPERLWLKKMLYYKKIEYEEFHSDNEIFYLITKLSDNQICSA